MPYLLPARYASCSDESTIQSVSYTHLDVYKRQVHYLCNSSVTIHGVRFYGVPMFMEDCISDRQARNYAAIPADTDILITHCPPYGILDFDDGINYGSTELLARVEDVSYTHL